MDIAPYFRRSHPAPQDPAQLDAAVIDLTLASLPDFPQPEPSGAVPDARPLANSLLDGRAAAAVSGTVGHPAQVTIDPPGQQASAASSLLQHINYDGTGAPNISVLSDMCLAAMAYADYFPGSPTALRLLVSVAIAQASPGWCGSTGPGVNTLGLGGGPAEYDMTQMFLLPIAYAFYEELNPDTRELLITSLLAGGTIHRVNIPGSDDAHTSGQCPEDWARAGRVASDDIPETENHVLMIATARYLTNQLLYQRDRLVDHDNRRNGVPAQSRPNCMDQVLGLLRNYLRDDFAEYNAKPYTEETRRALLNLSAFAYDAEVRLGARMVLDYISAHVAVSTNDLRRLVPFRRRNEEAHNVVTQDGFMANDLLGGLGTSSAQTADSNSPVFALLAGNTRGYPTRKLTTNFGPALVQEAVCGYRLPPSIHDLFVNDAHRRYFQRLHRRSLPELGDQRNCENMEIYVGSPSYLITAGGKPAQWSTPGQVVLGIPVHFDPTTKGVAVTTSFIPTGLSAGVPILNALDIIQLEMFSSTFSGETGPPFAFERANYGIAPDFACGYKCRFPNWLGPEPQDGPSFTEHISLGPDRPGFYLAIHRQQDLVVLEALDCWRYKHVSFDMFTEHVSGVNGGLTLSGDANGTYTTYSGNIISFRIGTSAPNFIGGQILSIAYGAGTAGIGLSDPPGDTLSDAGNYTPNVSTYQFLTGTILSSPVDGRIEIHNRALGSTLTLDWSDPGSDPAHLVRISETGEVEQAGQNYEMWVDFAWTGQTVGDFFLPCKTVTDAVNMVADGGVVKIVPGATTERLALPKGKRVRLTAPFGPVKISAQ